MSAPPRLLLVDDDPDDRLFAARELRRAIEGAVVEDVGDAATLERWLDSGAFDLVITDYALRWTDGLTVLRSIQSRWPNKPVVMFTATGNEEVAVEAMRSGLSDYVVKAPRHFARLPFAVNGALQRADQQVALRDAEERYRSLVERLPAIVYVDTADPPGTSVYLSPQIAAILGYEPDEIVGKPEGWFSLAHPDDRERMEAEVRRQAAEGSALSTEYRMRRKDGTTVWMHDDSAVVVGADGRASYVHGAAFEISDRRRLQEEMLQAQKLEAVGRLAGGIAHDFNNLLTAIGGYAHFLIDDLDPDDPRRADAQAIRTAADRAATLTRQLLAFSRRQAVRTELVDVAAVLEDMGRPLERVMGEDVRIVVRANRLPAEVCGDRAQLEQIVMNLAVNARDAMPDGGTLTLAVEGPGRRIDAEPSAGRVRLTVADSGAGMTPEIRERLFEPFLTTKPPGQGTGLGLAAVYGIVAAWSGTIDVDSVPGRGTTFVIELPSANRGVAGRAAARREIITGRARATGPDAVHAGAADGRLGWQGTGRDEVEVGGSILEA